MKRWIMNLSAILLMGLCPVTQAVAEEATLGEVVSRFEVAFDMVWLVLAAVLVFFMQAGFAMVESGLSRAKNAGNIMMKNLMDFSAGAVAYWAIGWALMYGTSLGGFIGGNGFFLNYTPGTMEAYGVGSMSAIFRDWMFQVVFAATAATIVSGAMAERTKFSGYLIYSVFVSGLIYPIFGSWAWGGLFNGGGWLEALGFIDFAGSTVVHSVGGWAALAGAIVLGPRLGKYGKNGKVYPIPGSNLALATLGTFILWLGWFGFNGGSQLAMGTVGDVSDVSRIFANTNMAAAAGAVTALILTQVMYKKPDLTMVLNGALAGLVSITAEPLAPTLFGALWIGAVGGVIVVFTVPLLDKLKIDDVVGAIPVHLFAGIWGTIAVIFYGEANLMTQLTGIVAYGVFTFVASLILWYILKLTIGIRVSEEEEINGLDMAELGMEAYPEFSKG